MTTRTSHYLVCAGRELHYCEWGAGNGETIIACPTLCLRGETSDLLLPEVAEAMTRRGPRARLATISGCGHAPALNVPAQLELIDAFLAGN